MADDFEVISGQDLKHLVDLIRQLEESSFDYLAYEKNGTKIVISKGDVDIVNSVGHGTTLSPSTSASQTADPSPASTPVKEENQPEEKIAPPSAPVDKDTIVITAPTAGRFYAQPEPGAPPYVKVGDEVDEETTVGLIEVMKVFTAVTAGVQGTIAEICVEDAQFVEYGQPLFRVKPHQQPGDQS